MIEVRVLYNGLPAGILSKGSGHYRFVYDNEYLASTNARPISLTLPLRKEPYESSLLFPCFINRLSEGSNKAMQSKILKIDENDYFGLLLATAGNDSVGPVSLQKI